MAPCAQARFEDGLAGGLEAFSSGSGSGSGVVPAAIASARAFTRVDENCSFWKTPGHRGNLSAESMVIPAWLRKAP
jgi:hypothetical protein